MVSAVRRQPFILPSISDIIASVPGSGKEPPTRLDAARQAVRENFGKVGLELFDSLTESDLASISEMLTSARDQGCTWDREDVARYIARLVFGDSVLRHPDIPELFRGLAIETGIMAEVEASPAAGRAWEDEILDHTHDYISDEIARFLRDLGPAGSMQWLHRLVHYSFRKWLLEQAEGHRITTLFMPSLVGVRKEESGPLIEFDLHFRQREGEGDDEALARGHSEFRNAFRKSHNAVRPPGQGPRSPWVYEKGALWFYCYHVDKLSYREIARRDPFLQDAERHSEVKAGIQKVQPLLL